MDNSLLDDQNYRLLKLMRNTNDAAIKVRKKELSKFGLLPRQAAVLFAIKALGEKVTATEIAHFLFREHHTITGIVSRMEKDGLVKRIRAPGGKNLTRIILTDKGEQAYHQSIKREATNEIMSTISEEERQQLKACLEKIQDAALRQLGINQKPTFP